MSKEQTPIEELIEISEEFLNIENGLFSRLKFTASDRKKVLAQRIDVAKQLLTKEKEQREELIKEVGCYQNLISKLIKQISDAEYHKSQKEFLKTIIDGLKDIKQRSNKTKV